MKVLTKQEATELKEYKGSKCITSLKVADITGKDHSNVLRDIRDMLKELDKTEGTFTLDYKSIGNHRTFKVLRLPEREFNILITGYSTVLRAKLYDEWSLMQSQQSPQVLHRETELKSELCESEETSSDKFKAIMAMAEVIKTNQIQSQQMLDMIKDMNETQPIETVIVNEETKLSDLIGKGKTKSTLKMIGL